MLAPLPPLLAYRLDRARSTDAADLSSRDATDQSSVASTSGVKPDDEVRWVRTAVTLERAVRSRGSVRETSLRQFLDDEGIHTLPEVGVPYPFIEKVARNEASQMEEWAFLRLAYTTLSALSAILPDAMILERGRVLAQRARVAYKLGATVAARVYYEEVEALAAAGSLPELKGRALIGFGVLAEFAGNFPASRSLFTQVLALEGAAADSVSMAHHGLMVAAAEAADFDRAIQHAWSAYSGAETDSQQSDMLVDLAQLLLLVGQPAAALCGFASALARQLSPRAALPALGGVALAAVGARETESARAVVRLVAAQTEALIASLGGGTSPAMPYHSASALTEVSEALSAVDETIWSRRSAAHAAQIAACHRFHRISHRLENPPMLPEKSAAPTRVQMEIAQRVEALEGAELIGAAG